MREQRGSPPASQSDYFETEALLMQRVAEIYKQAYESGATYAKALVGIGFAGFLTVWSKTYDVLGPRQKPLVALLLSVSLFVYIAFEVAQMILLGWLRMRFHQRLAKTRDLQTSLLEHDNNSQKCQATLSLVWYVSLILTVIPGFTGGAILIYAFIRRVL